MNSRSLAVSAAFLGALGVAAGAFGAHALKARLEAASMKDVWDTAARYQLVHAVALLSLASGHFQSTPAAASRAAWAGRLWTLGIVLFSGSLYLLALGAPRWTGAITPLGGACMIAGWICAGASALAGGPKQSRS